MTNDPERLHGNGAAEMTEEHANNITTSILGLSPAELDAVYHRETDDDPAQRLYELSLTAAAEYQKQGREAPGHVRAVLAALRQAQLQLDGPAPNSAVPQILIVDANPARLLNRREIFEAQQYRVHTATSLMEANDKLAAMTLQAAIVDWTPASEQETQDLRRIQEWNLQVPIINVAVWVGLMGHNERHSNRNLVRAFAKAFGKPVPRKLPERKPPAAQVCNTQSADGQDLFKMNS